jgi:hypothetical protein
MKERTSKKWQPKLFGAFSVIGFFLFVGSLFIWGCQVLMWLENGFWTEWTITKTLPGLSSGINSWESGLEIQKILLWVFDIELAIFVLILGLIIGLYFLHMAVDLFRSEGSADSR